MQHYLCLYVLAERFRIERLKNEVLDLVKAYYRTANMTAPAARLEYIYHATEGPNLMRRFLVTTAAYRLICERDGKVSNVMRQVSQVTVWEIRLVSMVLMSTGHCERRRTSNRLL